MKGNDTKHISELEFWAGNVEREGILQNSFYETFYVSDFKIDHEDYIGKAILDIGCGPRGSLEWADMADLRIGLDPLVNEYYKLDGGTLSHKMKYVRGYSEDMPFPDETFDFVFSINSLDHVDDLDETISEIKRVLKIGGICGIIVDANHKPTVNEPITIDLDLKDKFSDVFDVIDERAYETVYKTGFRHNLDDPTFYDFDKTPKKDADSFNILFNQNKKLKKENMELKKQVKAFKDRKVVKFADKFKSARK